MIGLLRISARNLTRNWLRTILTVLGASVALLAFVMLRTVLSSWEVGAEYAAKDRLGTRHKVSFIQQLPKKYIDDVRGVPGVKQATWANWFGGKDPKKPDEFFATLAVDGPSFLPVMDELVLTEPEKAVWMADKRGAIIGDVLAKKLGLKVGDKYTLQGSIYPGDWEFNIDGIYTAARKSLDRSQFIFHWNYLNDSIPEGRRDTIGWVMTRVEDPSKSASISASIDKIFDERDTQTVTMSERNMQLSFMAMFGTILTVLDIVSLVILVIMLLILGNTIAMGVRERTREYAVLRAIGFMPSHIRLFVLGEATALGIVAGLVGIAIAYPFVNNVIGRAIEENMGAWFPYFRVEPGVALTAVVIAIALSTTAALIPAVQAGRISVTDALRKVG
jgi:putative ABC transport system permease protein